MKKFSDYTSDAEMLIRGLGFDHREPESLYAPIAYALSAGGKRLRPALLLAAAEAFGGEEALEKAHPAACGIEIFHNFTLLHDDVMDRSDLRRGRPTVHKRWDENTAILSGDTMLTLATEFMCRVPADKLEAVMGTFNAMALEVYEGQSLDMQFENEERVSVDSYIEMIRKKTGALLGAATRIGAQIGGASEQDCARMETFGNMLGVAFQIQDDWLDTFGDPATFGKPIGGDILNDKKTFLLVSALDSGSTDIPALQSAMKMSGEGKIKAVTCIYEKMGIEELSRQRVFDYSSLAFKALKGTRMDEDYRELFRNLVKKLTGRKK